MDSKAKSKDAVMNSAGSAGPSGSRQGQSAKTYLPTKPISSASGNKSQKT